MKKIFKTLKITSALLFITVTFIACDKDFTTIESDIQGSENFGTTSLKFPVAAYNKKLGAVQTNNLSSYLLGIYKDDIYGSTTANVVSQVTLSSYNPDFGDNVVIDSVLLTIPYYVTTEAVDGVNQFKIDSLFGNTDINLSVYKNEYFLRDNDPENIEDSQNYYSNGNDIDFNGGVLLFQDSEFTPSNEIDINPGVEGDELTTPSLYLLETENLDFWRNLLKVDALDSPTELSNVNNFKNYFRGLYFKVESIPNLAGNLVMLDFSKAKIEVKYENDKTETNGDITRERQSFQLNLSGNIINIFEKDPLNNVIDIADAAANSTEGDVHLYLKGGEGSIAVIDLFPGPDSNNDDISDAHQNFLDTFKDKRLINEANLIFHVDETAGLIKEQEPDRVILYDMKNNVPIVDYSLDITNTTSPIHSKTFHSTRLNKNSNENGKYKIRLTEHLNNILLRDSTNLKLGLMVTTNINEIFQYSISESEYKLTSGTVMSPKGTVLHGSNESVVEANRVQLEITYSEPEN